MRQTPYYVFDTDEFAKRAAMIRAALDCKGGRRIPLCFSIKANPFLLHRLPEGLDHVEVCSPGELEICIALGVKPGVHHLFRRDEGKMRYRASSFIWSRYTDL